MVLRCAQPAGGYCLGKWRPLSVLSAQRILEAGYEQPMKIIFEPTDLRSQEKFGLQHCLLLGNNSVR